MAFNFDQNLVLCVQLLFTLLSSTVRHNAADTEFEVYLEVTDDKGYVDIWTYKSDVLDVDLVHEKATDLVQSALSRRYTSDQNNDASSSAVSEEKANEIPIRKKRSAESCVEEGPGGDAITGIIAEIGETVKVPCRFCAEDNRDTLNAKSWFRFERKFANGFAVFSAVPVKVEKHDDPKLNRIHVEPDHTLVIEGFQSNDMGAYFCEDYRPKTAERLQPFSFRISDVSQSSPAAILLGWKVVADSSTITFMTIIDVIAPGPSESGDAVFRFSLVPVNYLWDIQEVPEKEPATYDTWKYVSLTVPGYPKPTPPKKNTQSNWITYSEWGPWGECSKCGDGGERRRQGKCMLRKIEDKIASKPAYLEEVLKMYPKGAPCQSSLFQDEETMTSVRNEVEVVACNLPCGSAAAEFLGVQISKHVAGKSAGVFRKALDLGSVPTVPPFTQEGIDEDEGRPLKLFCPSVYIDSIVEWRKGHEVLNPTETLTKTSGRVKYDEYFRLVFKSLEVADAAHYACYVDSKVTVDYFLSVAPRYVDRGPWTPGLLMLVYWYSGSIGIFIVVVIIKHTQRFDHTRARALRTKKAQRKAMGYKSYNELYGRFQDRKDLYTPLRLKIKNKDDDNENENAGNNWIFDDDDEFAKLHMADIYTHVFGKAKESHSTTSTSSSENTSFASETGEQSSAAESDLESDDVYAILDSSSDWEISSHYSATGNDSDIPDEPHWMIF